MTNVTPPPTHRLACLLDTSEDCTCHFYTDVAKQRREALGAFLSVLDKAEEEELVVRRCATHDWLPQTDRFQQAQEDGEVECAFMGDLPMTDGMQRDWSEGYDPCMPVIGFTAAVLEEFYQ